MGRNRDLVGIMKTVSYRTYSMNERSFDNNRRKKGEEESKDEKRTK